LRSVYSIDHLFRAWPELRPAGLLWGWLFLTIDLAISVYLLLPGARRLLAQDRVYGADGSAQG
jgi:hypothetical protein